LFELIKIYRRLHRQCRHNLKKIKDDKEIKVGIVTDYFWIGNKPIATSRYWNMVHGNTPEEVKQDEEGLQIMRYRDRHGGLSEMAEAFMDLQKGVEESFNYTFEKRKNARCIFLINM